MRLSSTLETSGLRLAIVLAALSAPACKESADEPAPLAACADVVTITVNTATSQPQFTWSPTCSVSRLVVMSAPTAGKAVEHWRIEGDPNLIIPPIMFGRLPTGAKAISFVPIIGNQDYHVSIYVPDRATAVGDGSWHQP
jgi:hypothetical protein